MLYPLVLMILASATTPSVPLVMACKRPIQVHIKASRNIFEGGPSFEGVCCSSGIPTESFDGDGELMTARLSLSALPNGRTRIELKDLAQGSQLVGEIANDGKLVKLSSGEGVQALDAQVRIANTKAGGMVSVDAVNQPASRVAADAVKLAHRQIHGLELFDESRVTMKFDSIPFASLMQLLADTSGLFYEWEGDHKDTFSKQGDEDRSGDFFPQSK